MSSDNTPDEGVPGEGEAAPLEAPKIEFPCLYPIKIIGKAGVGFQREVIATVERHFQI